MTIRFTKAAREQGVDGHFLTVDSRVTVKPSEFQTPLHPEDAGYWDQFDAVLKAVCAAKQNAIMRNQMSPALVPVTGGNAATAAKLVHKDMPTDIMLIAFRAIKEKRFRLGRGFTDGPVLLNHLMSWAAHAVSANSFCAKWHFMAARPEEIAGAIARDEIDAPDTIKLRLFTAFDREAIIQNQRTFTMYDEGSPDHPGYNAMHAAAASAGASIILAMMDLDDDDRAQVVHTAYDMAHFRSTAGVHTPQDNNVGLWLGQETVQRLLAGKMAEFGIARADTEKALSNASVQWIKAA